MIKYLILGSTGMAGHMITIFLLEKGHDVTAYSRRPFNYCKNILDDAFHIDKLKEIITKGNYDVIVNCLGILNNNAQENQAKAVFINSYIPHMIADFTKYMKTKIIHLSTDCVFSGNTGSYTENSFKDGKLFYDVSKSLGEIINNKDLTFRNSIIGPDINENGIGLFNWFVKQNGEILGYKNSYWNGITTLELAKAIEIASMENLTGLYQLTPNKNIDKYHLLQLFLKYFHTPVTILPYENQYINKTLVTTRKDFDFQIQDYEIMMDELKCWIKNHQELYPHYFDKINIE